MNSDLMKIFRVILLIVGIPTCTTNAMLPFPPLYTPQTYQTNPAFIMDPQRRFAVQQAFIWAENAFRRNHYICRNRNECLNLDLKSLTSYIYTYPMHPATLIFKNIYTIISQDSQQQKFVSEWVVFQNLSPIRQMEYRNGLRVTPIQPQYVRAPWGTTWVSTPGFFNQDDVLTDLIQQLGHNHRNCDRYINCLRGDLQIVTNLINRLAPLDPARITLANVRLDISRLADTKRFNTSLYLSLYNPLSPSWNDVLKKQKAKKLAGYGYIEWQQIEKNTRATNWRSPQFTNGTPIQQTIPYGNNRLY